MNNRFFTIRAARLFFWACLSLGLLCGQAVLSVAPTRIVIGQPAVLPPPPDSQYQTALNFLPANGDVVTLNPPQFQWLYTTNFAALTTDSEPKTFVFQVAYDSNFVNLAVNVTTLWNFYNTVAPFTQSTCYWRVGYVHGIAFTNGIMGAASTNNAIYYWSPTYQFTIDPSATVWDRSMMANPSYLASKATHPYMLMKASDLAGMTTWLNSLTAISLSGTTNELLSDCAKGYKNIAGTAAAQIAQPYWPASLPPSSSGIYNWSAGILEVAFMWATTHSPQWSAAHPEVAADLLATYYITNNGYGVDMILNSTAELQGRALAFAYDWCYSLFTPAQRTNVLHAIALHCNWVMCDEQYGPVWLQETGVRLGTPDPTGLYTNGLYRLCGSSAASQGDFGSSHGTDNFNTAMIDALAGYNEDPWCSNLFQMGINYLMGPSYTYRRELGSGRPYTMVHFGGTRLVTTYPTLAITFPEAGWQQNPFLTEIMTWWDHIEPVAFAEYHEPWGDTGYGQLNDWQAGFWQIATMMNNGNWMEHWWNQQLWYKSQNHGPQMPDANTLTMAYYYYNPAIFPPMTPTTNLSIAFTNQGWVVAHSQSPSIAAGFNNGVNLYFQARPNGATAGHTYLSDGSFQIQAYGANITDAGGGAIYSNPHNSWAHQTLTINGLGEECANSFQPEPYYAYISAYTNTPTCTYVAADLTRCYGHYSLGAFAVDPLPGYNSLNGAGSLGYVTNVSRQILFNRGAYFVIYDTLQTANPPTNIFSWTYHVYPSNLVANPETMTFTYNSANYYSGQTVPVYVAFVNAPSELAYTNMVGSNGSLNYQINPITGENYWSLGGAPGDSPIQPSSVLWVSNVQPTNDFHFMTVIFPVAPGDNPPTITRLDDATVTVNINDGVTPPDTICFDPASTNAALSTVLVNSPTIVNSGGEMAVANPGSPPLNNSTGSSGGGSSGGGPTTSKSAPKLLAAPSNLHIVTPYTTNNILPTFWAWWNPDTISGAGGSPVSSWVDSSPVARAALQNSSPAQPVLGAKNGHNTLVFNGTSDFLAWNDTSVLPQPLEIFAVAQPNRISSEMMILNNENSSSYFDCEYLGGSHNWAEYAGAYLDTSDTGSTNWAQVTFIFNGANSQFFVDGVLAGTGNSGSDGLSGVLIGAFQNQKQNFWNGQIGDILIYTNVVDSTTQAQIENSLRAKFGF